MTAQIAELKVGDPFDNETDIGSMVSEGETARVCEWLDGPSRTGHSSVPAEPAPARPFHRRL